MPSLKLCTVLTLLTWGLLFQRHAAGSCAPPCLSGKSGRADVGADLEIIRDRVIQDLVDPALDERLIEQLIKEIRSDGTWPGIDYVDVSRTGFEHSRHLDNMFQLSRAYKKKDSRWYQHPVAKQAALSALDFWLEHDFMCDNWWWNEMGTPVRMINTLLVLDTDLTEDQTRQGLRIAGRANLEASGARPGGDLIQMADILGRQALFRRDETVLEQVVRVMSSEIKVTTGRGLKPDMSFHHRVDNVISTLSYGLGYASSFAYWAVKIAGTKYQFPEHATNLLIDYFLDGICKSMAHAKYPDAGARNRDLSRKGALNAASATLAENLLMTSEHRRDELEEIIRIRNGSAAPRLSWNRFYWHSEYFTHQRPDFFASVRMHSARNHTMEQPHNEEGLKMHHVGDGSNFVSRSGKEYLDIFPVWDWQKIPGTTIVQKPVHPHWKEIAKQGLTDFVGGVSNGKFGAAAMDFKSAHDPLTARKAWFFFDNEYVCLGSGIISGSEYPVVTTVNQCLLKGEVQVKAKRSTVTIEEDSREVADVSWVLHDSIGYVFPTPRQVNLSNRVATGSWRDINHQTGASAEDVRLGVFTLWLDHGVKPADGSYEYIVVPAAHPAALDQYAKNSYITILENSTSVQAVRHAELAWTQVVFYVAGKIKMGDHMFLSADSPCMVMIKTDGKRIEQLVLSDPTHKLSSLELTTSAFAEGSGDDWQAVWNKKEKKSVINVNLPSDGYAGQSVVLNFADM